MVAVKSLLTISPSALTVILGWMASVRAARILPSEPTAAAPNSVYIERRRTDHGIIPGCDICVMNSVANLKRSLDFILGHRRIDLFLDNDKAGRDTSEAIIKAAPGIDVMDHSGEYAGYGDLNEFHMKEPME